MAQYFFFCNMQQLQKTCTVDLNARCLRGQLRVFAMEETRFCKIKAFYSNRMYSYGIERQRKLGRGREKRVKVGRGKESFLSVVFFFASLYIRSFVSSATPIISSYWWNSRRVELRENARNAKVIIFLAENLHVVFWIKHFGKTSDLTERTLFRTHSSIHARWILL